MTLQPSFLDSMAVGLSCGWGPGVCIISKGGIVLYRGLLWDLPTGHGAWLGRLSEWSFRVSHNNQGGKVGDCGLLPESRPLPATMSCLIQATQQASGGSAVT